MKTKRVTLWGARSGIFRDPSERRSHFSMMEREIDKQFEDNSRTRTANRLSKAPQDPTTQKRDLNG